MSGWVLLPAFVSTVLAVIAVTAILNGLTFPRLGRRRAEVAGDEPALPVSLLIPARDEAPRIGATVRSLLDQDYPDLEVLVLDDRSQDGTADAARAAAPGDERLRVLAGIPLPAGWIGKNWACHQLSLAARGELLVFSDADVRWTSGAVAALTREIAAGRADLLTVWPTQETVTWGERLVVPLMAFAILGYLPVPLVHHTPVAAFAAANGQCLAFRREAYRRVGGHVAVRENIVEDVALARNIKQAGLRLRMADGAGLIATRMYEGWPAVRDGYAKNILAGYGNHVWALLLSTLFHWVIFLFPWAWLLGGAVASWTGSPTIPVTWPWWPLALIAAGVGVRALSAAVTRQRARDALLLPISVLLMTIIACQAIWWRWRYGGPRWKGRTYGGANGNPPPADGEEAIHQGQPPSEAQADLVEGHA